MSKKILSFALAVVMLVSVFAFSASATTFPTTGQCGYRVVSDAYVGMPAGETVTVKVYYVLPDDLDLETYRHQIANVFLCYNSNAFTYVGNRTWGDSYSAIFKNSNINNIVALAKAPLTNVAANFTENDKAKNYDSCAWVQLGYQTGIPYTSKTGFPVDPYGEIFSIQFKTAKTLESKDYIGIPEASLTSQTAARYCENTKNYTYSKENTIIDEGFSSADYVAVNEYADLKIRNNAADTNKVDLGITGEFKNVSFPVEFGANGTTCTNLSKIGVEVRMNGVIRTADCDGDLNYIYPTADGYKFRAAVTGIDAAGLDTKVEVRVYMVTDNGTYYSNWMGCSARAAYTNAVAGGMSAIA